MKESILFEKSQELCHKGLDVVEKLISIQKFNFAKQLEKSVTSIAANISESEHAESKKDFIHKLRLASKEARETELWFNLIIERKIVSIEPETLDQLNHIQRMLSKSISTVIKRDNRK